MSSLVAARRGRAGYRMCEVKNPGVKLGVHVVDEAASCNQELGTPVVCGVPAVQSPVRHRAPTSMRHAGRATCQDCHATQFYMITIVLRARARLCVWRISIDRCAPPLVGCRVHPTPCADPPACCSPRIAVGALLCVLFTKRRPRPGR